MKNLTDRKFNELRDKAEQLLLSPEEYDQGRALAILDTLGEMEDFK